MCVVWLPYLAIAGFWRECWFSFAYLGWRRSIVLFVLVEVLLAVTVRDNLSLNVLMLLCPIDAVKQWQMVH